MADELDVQWLAAADGVQWAAAADEELRQGVHRLIGAVVELGGAVGWTEVPERAVTDAWLDTALAAAPGGVVIVRRACEVQALGAWAADTGVHSHVATLSKVMAHPRARGHGLGRLVLTELLRVCTEAAMEIAVLGVRGNNHGAIALYESVGLRIWGVVPNGIAVDEQRFDDVRMVRQLALPADTVLRGQEPGGLGGSYRRALGRQSPSEQISPKQ